MSHIIVVDKINEMIDGIGTYQNNITQITIK